MLLMSRAGLAEGAVTAAASWGGVRMTQRRVGYPPLAVAAS